MDGFGASFTDSSAWLVGTRMSAGQRIALMTNLFSPSAGIGLSMVRQPIGTSDDHGYVIPSCSRRARSIRS
jgi:glucosylceramidase